MSRGGRVRRWALAAAVAALAVGLAGAARANHTEQPRNGLVEVGFQSFGNSGFNTDVWAHATTDGRLFAYTGTYGTLEVCPSLAEGASGPQQSGVRVTHATDPARPTVVARIPTPPGSKNNDVKVARLTTPSFTGDVLAMSLEPCGADALLAQVDAVEEIPREQTGFQLVDVTEPTEPVVLGAYNNGGAGTHNLFAFDRPDLGRAFVAAVFNEAPLVGRAGEASAIRGELQMVDITDPAAPALVATWELADAQAQGGPAVGELCRPRGGFDRNCTLHDVWASPDGRTLYLSFWDAGLVLLDVGDPAAPTFLGQLQPGGIDNEGNTHAAVPLEAGGRRFVVVGDEDFLAGAASAGQLRVNAPPDLAATHALTLWSNSAPPDPPLTADLVYAGTGCTLANYVTAGVDGRIALVDSYANPADPLDQCPTFTFAQKAQSAEQAGAVGLVQIDSDDTPSAGDAQAAGIPAGEIANSAGVPLRQRLLAGDGVNVTLGFAPGVDPWGFMRLVDVTEADPATWRQVATFRTPHVDDPVPAPDSIHSAHNPIVGPDGRVYFAWYSDGLRVLEVGGEGAVREVAWFAPRPQDHPGDNDTDPHGAFEADIGFWGSFPTRHPQTGRLLVFNSDINRGLYVVGYPPEPAPPPTPPPPDDGPDRPLPATGAGVALLAAALAALTVATRRS